MAFVGSRFFLCVVASQRYERCETAASLEVLSLLDITALSLISDPFLPVRLIDDYPEFGVVVDPW